MVRVVLETGETAARWPSGKHQQCKREHAACHATGQRGNSETTGSSTKFYRLYWVTRSLSIAKRQQNEIKDCLIFNGKEKIAKQY